MYNTCSFIDDLKALLNIKLLYFNNKQIPMAFQKKSKLPISNRIQVLLRTLYYYSDSTIRSPMKTLLAFITLNFTSYIVYNLFSKVYLLLSRIKMLYLWDLWLNQFLK